MVALIFRAVAHRMERFLFRAHDDRTLFFTPPCVRLFGSFASFVSFFIHFCTFLTFFLLLSLYASTMSQFDVFFLSFARSFSLLTAWRFRGKYCLWLMPFLLPIICVYWNEMVSFVSAMARKRAHTHTHAQHRLGRQIAMNLTVTH